MMTTTEEPNWEEMLCKAPDAELYRELGRRRAARGAGRKPVLHICAKCGAAVLGTREFRKHRCQNKS